MHDNLSAEDEARIEQLADEYEEALTNFLVRRGRDYETSAHSEQPRDEKGRWTAGDARKALAKKGFKHEPKQSGPGVDRYTHPAHPAHKVDVRWPMDKDDPQKPYFNHRVSEKDKPAQQRMKKLAKQKRIKAHPEGEGYRAHGDLADAKEYIESVIDHVLGRKKEL